MPKHRHANIQSRARAVFTFALPTILALAALATTVAWAAPASGTPGGTDTPRLTATLATADGGREACGDGDVHLVCTIAHEGLEPNARYRATVTLSDTEAHKPIEDEDGKAVEATHTFTPDQENGTVEVVITLDGRRHLGRTIGATVAIRSGVRTIATREVSGDPVRIPKITAAVQCTRDEEGWLCVVRRLDVFATDEATDADVACAVDIARTFTGRDSDGNWLSQSVSMLWFDKGVNASTYDWRGETREQLPHAHEMDLPMREGARRGRDTPSQRSEQAQADRGPTRGARQSC